MLVDGYNDCKCVRQSLELKPRKVKALVALSCQTLCNPVDCSPPDSSVHGILQARILEWAAISFSRGMYGRDQHSIVKQLSFK